MKKSFFKKLMVALTAFGGMFVMASCQTTAQNANVPIEYCSVAVLEEPSATVSGAKDKIAVVTLAVQNPTIYNTTEITFKYQTEDVNHQAIGNEETVVLPIGIRHGVAGAFSYTYRAKAGEADDVQFVKITEAHISGYQTAWQTYMPAFIVAICLASLSVLFYGIEIFRKGLSKENAKEMFAEHLASEMTVLGLVLIICLIPLIFSSWVTTVVLLGGFVGAVVLSGLLTLIRIRFAK